METKETVNWHEVKREVQQVFEGLAGDLPPEEADEVAEVFWEKASEEEILLLLELSKKEGAENALIDLINEVCSR